MINFFDRRFQPAHTVFNGVIPLALSGKFNLDLCQAFLVGIKPVRELFNRPPNHAYHDGKGGFKEVGEGLGPYAVPGIPNLKYQTYKTFPSPSK